MRFLLFSFLLLFTVLANAQGRKYSNEFLKIGIGADAMAKAGAVVATSQGVQAAYWNPAGLGNLQTREAGIMHASYFAGIANYNYLAGAMPLDNGKAVGLSLIRFGVDDILNTSELIDADGNVDYDRISLFNAADYAVIASYAQPFKDRFTVGVNAKLVYRHIGDFARAIGFGFDLGAQTEWKGWKTGVVLRDITGTFNAWFINPDSFSETLEETGNELPEDALEITLPSLQVGASRDFTIYEGIGLEAEIDLFGSFDGKRNDLISTNFASFTPALGLNFDYENFVFLRLGMGNFQNYQEISGGQTLGFQPNLGLGLVYNNIQIDYALTDIGDQSVALYSNIFSVKFAF